MREVAKHHRIIELQNARGDDGKWLAIDCAFIDSGIQFALKNDCRRVLFGAMDDTKKAGKVGVDVLKRLPELEGLIWQIPVPKGTVIAAQKRLKYLSIVKPGLTIDLTAFPALEYLGCFFSEGITGYDKASKSLGHVSVSGLSTDLRFLGALKSLVELDIARSDIASLSGIEKIGGLEVLSLMLCRKLASVSQAARLKNLVTLSIEGSSALTDLSSLKQFKALKTLWLKIKEIESCRFISGMKSIEFASINARIKDNDVSPFLKSKTLDEVWFSPTMRAYSPKLSPDDINELLAARRKGTLTR